MGYGFGVRKGVSKERGGEEMGMLMRKGRGWGWRFGVVVGWWLHLLGCGSFLILVHSVTTWNI